MVQSVLLSNKVNYWTGQTGRIFEREFAKATNTQYAIALANGTVALELAFHALGIGGGDDVVVTPRSFMASASAIKICGANPIFADVDPVSQNITAESVANVLTDRTRAIVCVHLAGWPCDMEPLMALANRKNLFIIEDCAQAHGAKYQGKSVGGWGDIAAWSFCQDKIMTTGGEGGMITTNRAELYEKMWSYKDHGKNRHKMESPPTNCRFKYVHDRFGTNFRLTEMQSAIGLYQLEQLEDWHKARTANAARYQHNLAKSKIVRLAIPPTNISHAYYKYYCFLNSDQFAHGWDRDAVVEEVNHLGGSCFSGSCPEIYKEQAFVDFYGAHPELPVASQLGKESLMLNCHPGISKQYIDYNSSIINQVLSRVSK